MMIYPLVLKRIIKCGKKSSYQFRLATFRTRKARWCNIWLRTTSSKNKNFDEAIHSLPWRCTVIKLQWLLPLSIWWHICTVIAFLQLGRVHLMNVSDRIYEYLYTVQLYCSYIHIWDKNKHNPSTKDKIACPNGVQLRGVPLYYAHEREECWRWSNSPWRFSPSGPHFFPPFLSPEHAWVTWMHRSAQNRPGF